MKFYRSHAPASDAALPPDFISVLDLCDSMPLLMLRDAGASKAEPVLATSEAGVPTLERGNDNDKERTLIPPPP